MKDSQHLPPGKRKECKYIKANNERFSTRGKRGGPARLSISRRIMKDSQLRHGVSPFAGKYIKANNERFSTAPSRPAITQ